MRTFVYENPDRSGWWVVKAALENGEVWVTEVGPQTSEMISFGVHKYALSVERQIHEERQQEGEAHLIESLNESNRWDRDGKRGLTLPQETA